MSGEDLLSGLPLPVAPLAADLFGHRPVLGDDGFGLGGNDRYRFPGRWENEAGAVQPEDRDASGTDGGHTGR
jgi:hypothetical protein